jgi:hypothetical protein
VIHSAAHDAEHGAVLARVTRAVVLAEILVVAGCSDIHRAYYAVTNAVTNTVHTAFYEPRHTTPARAASRPAAPSPWQPQSTPAPKEAASAEAAPVVVDGLSGKAVRALLGRPAASAGPAPGETWTYRSGTCEVELYLFPDVSHGGLQVLDHRINGAGAREDTKQACLKRLRDEPSG